MSGSKKGDRTKVGLIAGILVAILAFTSFVSWGLSESAKYQGKADYEASEHARYTSDKVAKTCVGIPATEQVGCLGDAVDAQRAYERDEQDLVAQRQSALWAYVMAIAAVIGMGLSVVGVFLVWTTFRETRRTADEALRANEISGDTAKRQLRAYLTCDDTYIDFGKLISPNTADTLFHIRNSGQTPAYEVRITSRVEYATGDPSSHRMLFRGKPTENVPAKGVIASGGKTHQRSDFPIPEGFFKEILAGKLVIVLAIIISYRDVFGRRRLVTGRYFYDPHAKGEGGVYPLGICSKGTSGN